MEVRLALVTSPGGVAHWLEEESEEEVLEGFSAAGNAWPFMPVLLKVLGLSRSRRKEQTAASVDTASKTCT